MLLVQDEHVTRQADPYLAQSTTKLVGLEVVTEDNYLLGKVAMLMSFLMSWVHSYQ